MNTKRNTPRLPGEYARRPGSGQYRAHDARRRRHARRRRSQATNASSHREAPFIASDPEADNTDLYAFVSPDMTNTVTIVANYIPLEQPQGGPNFYKFGDNVLYEIKIDYNGDGEEDVNYQFRFHTEVRNPNTFLYNTGPIGSLTDPNWNIRQFYSVTRIEGNHHQLHRQPPADAAGEHRPALDPQL